MKRLSVLAILVLSFPLAASNTFEELVPQDLLRLQSNTSYYDSASEIQRQNEITLRELETYVPGRVAESEKGERLNAVSYDWAVKAMRSIDRHPVVSSYQYSKYNNKGVEIGFCFGRATYVHLALLKMGVNKDAIKKIWVVGPMNAGGIMWAFHVGTVVKGEEPGQWWVIDNYPGQVLEVRDWYEYMASSSVDKELKVYITEPNKFSVSLSTYSRVQMGLDLSREQDWYSHYFKDMMEWFGKDDLESVGLRDLRSLE